MADGAHLEHGENAALLVVLESKSAGALAPILLLLMAEHNVQDPTKTLKSVIMALAQVSKNNCFLLSNRLDVIYRFSQA